MAPMNKIARRINAKTIMAAHKDNDVRMTSARLAYAHRRSTRCVVPTDKPITVDATRGARASRL